MKPELAERMLIAKRRHKWTSDSFALTHEDAFEEGAEWMHNEMSNEIEQLKDKLKKAKEALEFYANDTSWNSQGHFHNSRIDSTDMSKVEPFPQDYEFGGRRARAALKEIGDGI